MMTFVYHCLYFKRVETRENEKCEERGEERREREERGVERGEERESGLEVKELFKKLSKDRK